MNDQDRPLSLPQRLYLLCYDLTRDRPGDDTARVVVVGDPAGVALEDAVLAASAVDGDARTVVTGRELREHRDAVRALGRHVDAALPGLRQALVWSVAARRTAASV